MILMSEASPDPLLRPFPRERGNRAAVTDGIWFNSVRYFRTHFK